MYSQAVLIKRINHLQEISPRGAASLFSGLITAINEYFNRDAELLGQINQRWSKEQRNFAHHCYISRGFDSVIRMFNLNVFEPHYIEEIRGR